jgi:hypothetical protein
MLNLRIIPRQKLTAGEADAMLALMRAYFDQVSTAAFYRDLDEKDWIVLLQLADATIVGFSTQKLISLPLAGRTARFLFSGDTIIHHQHWNQPGLAGAFGHLMLRLIADFPSDELYWFLISKGPRTYRFLPVFFNDFHPDPLRLDTMCGRFKRQLDAIAAHKFGGDYQLATGIVRFSRPKDHLKPEWQQEPHAPDTNPHVRFFQMANPGWREGDELACLAPITHENLNAYARRVIRATHPVWEC